MRALPLTATALCLTASLSGCMVASAGSMAAGVAGTAVRAPFKVAGKAYDLSTTSQAEADRNLGRKVRKQREREAREQRERRNQGEGPNPAPDR